MKRVLAILLVLSTLLTLTACGGSSSVSKKTEKKTVGQSFVTDDFTLTVTDFKFVSAANFSDYSYNPQNVVEKGYSGNQVIAYFKFRINNTGAKNYNLFFSKPALVADEIVFDGGTNGVAKYYCITTNGGMGEVAPYENKVFNYCIFNIPTAMMNEDSLELHFNLGGVECIYKIN